MIEKGMNYDGMYWVFERSCEDRLYNIDPRLLFERERS
jgi:hypothetical protein